MSGLARKITSDFRSKKKEDLIKDSIKSSFESTWFKVEDTETDMPMLDKKKVEKLFFVDGSKRHIKKYSDAIYKSLRSIAPISRVVNSDNLKEIPKFFKDKREKIKKETKLKWPKLNFAHSYYKDLEILTLTIAIVLQWSDDVSESSLKERCIKIGESGPLQLILVVNQDGSLKETIIETIHAISKAKGIHVPPQHLLSIEEFNKWRAERDK